jgi:hypothetical protein
MRSKVRGFYGNFQHTSTSCHRLHKTRCCPAPQQPWRVSWCLHLLHTYPSRRDTRSPRRQHRDQKNLCCFSAAERCYSRASRQRKAGTQRTPSRRRTRSKMSCCNRRTGRPRCGGEWVRGGGGVGGVKSAQRARWVALRMARTGPRRLLS